MRKKWIVTSVILGLCLLTGIVKHYKSPYFLSVAAIMKNEKPYLKEWLEYHMLQGVEHFYLCDNDSTDNTKEYLEPYIKKGVITYIPLPGKNQQKVCYDKIVKEYKEKTEWLAIIDLDEYMVPLEKKDMKSFLKEFSDVSEVSLHWMNYGDSGAFKRSGGLLTEFFTSHGIKLNHTVKSIVRPKDVIDGFDYFGSNHYVRVSGKSVNENHMPVNFMLGFYPSAKKARINHYIIKSFAEFIHKKSRGHPEGTALDYGYYFFHNDNEIKNDTAMLRFIPKLKKRMKKSPLKDVPLPVVADLPESFDDFYFSKEEASAILGQRVTQPMKFKDAEKAYHNQHPQYNNIDKK